MPQFMFLLRLVTRYSPISLKQGKVVNEGLLSHWTFRRITRMTISDTQVYIALVVALIPGILARRLSTELYK